MPTTKTKDPQAELIEALIEFQRTCPSIAKDKEGYGYKYTPLEKFLSVVNPALNKVGLAQSQSYDFAISPDGENSKTIIVTTLFHTSGASITSRLPVREPLGKNAKKDIMHEWGGITTYSRRYALKMILGLEPDMDMNLEDVIERNEPAKKEIVRSPQRGANAKQVKPSPVAHEMVTGKVAETPKASLTQSQSNQIKKFMTAHPDGWEGIVKAFNDRFNKTGDKISQSITTQEQITFILERITGYENLSR
tara:strand:- start:45 stop:794 length:750 start_codon:yes stop_codon:yes gene_type:complete